MGKFNANPQKLINIVQYFQRSRVAHNIKDLEKQLPSVASINGMQVKDYLQTLSDENKIHVEKIGSGNWYWSFASEDKIVRQQALENSRLIFEQASTAVEDVKRKLADIDLQLKKEEHNVGGEYREQLIASKLTLETEVGELQKELELYCNADPTKLELKMKEILKLAAYAEQFTDDIYSMEGWLKNMGQDEEGMKAFRRGLYGDELDEESGLLKDLA